MHSGCFEHRWRVMTFSAAPVRRPMTILLELRRRLGVAGPIGRIQGALEMLGRGRSLDTLGARRSKTVVLVGRPVLRALAQHRLELRLTMVLSPSSTAASAPCTVDSRSPAPSYNDTEAQLASRPAALGLHRRHHPVKRHRTVHAVAATSSVSSRTLASNWGRCVPTRRERLGQCPASSSRASCCPTHPTPPRPHAAPGERSASRPARRMRRPVSFDDAHLALHRSDRPLARARPI